MISLQNHRLSLTLGADADTIRWAALFTILFTLFDSTYSNGGLINAASSLAASTHWSFTFLYVACLSVSLYLLFLYALVTLNARLVCAVPLIALFSFSCLIEYSYLAALGRFTGLEDVTAAMTATTEQKQHSIAQFISLSGIIPSVGLAFVWISRRSKQYVFGFLPVLLFLSAWGVFFLQLALIDKYFFDRTFHSSSFTSFGQTLAEVALYVPAERLAPASRLPVHELSPEARSQPVDNIVVVFDESVRSDRLSLNGYSRRTTPYLESLEERGLLVNWGTAVSASTSSLPSYNAFIVGISPEELSQTDFSAVNTRPTIFQFAKAAGYKTYFFDGQMMYYWGGSSDDLTYIDEHYSLGRIDNPQRVEDYQRNGGKYLTDETERRDGMKQWDIDARIAELVKEVIESSRGNFIFVYKRGAHFPYEKNYPPEQAAWRPVHRFTEQYEVPGGESLQGVINSYDNAVRFNLDRFFKTLSTDYSRLPNSTKIIYTSDHGESFFQNGRAGHGGDSIQEASVPLFILGIDPELLNTRTKASHCNVFSTLLDLMRYPTPLRERSYCLSLLNLSDTVAAPRRFNTPQRKLVNFE